MTQQWENPNKKKKSLVQQTNCNENKSQITRYAANGDWLFVTYYVLKSIDHAISVQELQKPL